MYQFLSASGLVGFDTYEADSMIWEVFARKSADSFITISTHHTAIADQQRWDWGHVVVLQRTEA